MTKKKLDNRIRTLIENGVHSKHRSLFVLVGDHGKDQIPNLHYILSKSQVAKRPNVLWCYKKELGFSSHRQKRMKQMKKMKQLGLAAPDTTKEEDPFELFLTSTDIRYTYYSETDKILGQTFGMCVLQDFEALTPNLLARTIETVQGGGVVVLLLKTLSSLKQLYSMVMDVHSRYRTETRHEAVGRFNERFLLSLASCESCLVLDDELNVLPIFSKSREIVALQPSEDGSRPEERELVKMKQDLSEDAKQKVAYSLVSLAKTLDQAKCIQGIASVLQDQRHAQRTTVSLTAGRGRGKSAALGLTLAAAVANGYGNMFVTAPSPENLRTLFEFLFKGLEALGYQEHMDYDIVQSVNDEIGRCVVRVNIFKASTGHRQTIMYVQPQDAHLVAQAELVLVDEAAAIPLPLVQALSTGAHLVLMASTINGYEGTGRALSLKLIQQLRAQSTNLKEGLPSASTQSHGTNLRVLRELQLTEPIRYALGDPVERWLNGLLCLDAASVAPPKPARMPHPDRCELYAVNRDTLFSHHRASELFLQRMMALYVASHYKNTPNDLQLMSDAPAHRLFVLLAPVEEGAAAGALPDILAVVQVCLEGQISRQAIMASLARGKRSAGDLIPWTISQQFQDDGFASLSGARVVRVAVHPDMQKMGYGTRALQLLEQFYKGELAGSPNPKDGEPDEDDEDYQRPASAAPTGDIHSETLKPRANLPPLLSRLSDKRPMRLHWLGVSFGLTQQLFRFWKRSGMLPVYLRQTTNDITGEHTMVMIKGLLVDAQIVQCSADWLQAFYEDFRRRFTNLLGFQFRAFTPALCLDILEGSASTESSSAPHGTAVISSYDLKRMESYANNMVDYHMIMDLVPGLARDYFLTPVTRRPFSLSPVQAAILLSLGLQHRMIEDLEKELKLPVSQLLAMFIKCIRKFSALHRETKLEALNKDAEEAGEAVAEDAIPMPSTGAKRSLEEEWDPTEQGLDEDLEEAADEATARLRAKQRELINSLDLDKYKIAGTEEDWNKEIKKKAKNLSGSVLNIAGVETGKEGKKQKSVAKEIMAEGKKLTAKKGKALKR